MTNNKPQPSVLRAQTPGELLDVVPYLLGFHPSDSLVLLVLQDDGRVACTMRADLDAAQAPGYVSASLDAVAQHCPAVAVVAIAYTDDEEKARDVLRCVSATVNALGVSDLLWCAGQRWESVLTGAGGTCAEVGVLAAEATYQGMVAAPSREAITKAAQCDAPEPEWEQLSLAADAALAGVETVKRRELLTSLLDHAEPLTGPDLATLACLLTDPDVRDVALVQVSHDSAPRLVPFWADVVNRIPDGPLAVQPLALLGMCAWVDGQGALVVACLERGLRLNPRASLLHVLDEIATRAIPPSWWEAAREHIADAAE